MRSGNNRGLNEAVAHLVHGRRTSAGLKRLQQIVHAAGSPGPLGLRLIVSDVQLAERVLAWLAAGVVVPGVQHESPAEAFAADPHAFFATAGATQLATAAFIPAGSGVKDVDWLKHAVVAARLAYWMGQRSADSACSPSFAAGLQNLGMVGVAQYDPRFYPSVVSRLSSGEEVQAVEEDLLGFTHAEVGALALAQTGFPEWIVRAVRDSHAPWDPAGPVDGIVQVADHVVTQMGYTMGLGPMCRSVHPSLAGALDPATTELLVTEVMAGEAGIGAVIGA